MQKIMQTIGESISEVKKIDFPTQETTRITTIAVVVMILIVSSIIGVIDFIFSRIFKFIF